MNLSSLRLLRPLTVIAAAAALTFATGCSDSGDPADDGSATTTSACAPVEGTLIAAEHTVGQPRVELPQPQNWERTAKAQEQPPVQLILLNQTLTSDGFTPNIVVTVTPSSGAFQAVIDNELSQLRSGLGTEVPAGERGTVCGFDSYTVTYHASGAPGVPVHPITSRMIVVPTTGGASYTVVLTVQTLDPENATYQADSRRMLDDVQVKAA